MTTWSNFFFHWNCSFSFQPMTSSKNQRKNQLKHVGNEFWLLKNSIFASKVKGIRKLLTRGNTKYQFEIPNKLYHLNYNTHYVLHADLSKVLMWTLIKSYMIQIQTIPKWPRESCERTTFLCIFTMKRLFANANCAKVSHFVFMQTV